MLHENALDSLEKVHDRKTCMMMKWDLFEFMFSCDCDAWVTQRNHLIFPLKNNIVKIQV